MGRAQTNPQDGATSQASVASAVQRVLILRPKHGISSGGRVLYAMHNRCSHSSILEHGIEGQLRFIRDCSHSPFDCGKSIDWMNNSTRSGKRPHAFEIDPTRPRFPNDRKVATCMDSGRSGRPIGCACPRQALWPKPPTPVGAEDATRRRMQEYGYVFVQR